MCPYITQDERKKIDPFLDLLIVSIDNPGKLNYAYTYMAHKYLKSRGVNYKHINEVIGVLSCVQHELYDKIARWYEDKKELENGGIGVINASDNSMDKK